MTLQFGASHERIFARENGMRDTTPMLKNWRRRAAGVLPLVACESGLATATAIPLAISIRAKLTGRNFGRRFFWGGQTPGAPQKSQISRPFNASLAASIARTNWQAT
jgi:hypothetical protein